MGDQKKQVSEQDLIINLNRIMITVANCLNLDEAQSFKMILESAGIPSFIPDESSAGIAPHHFLTGSGVRLQVADENAEEAKSLIEESKRNR